MKRRFRKSLAIRHLVCGSCNGCEHEMNALENLYYDISQEGWAIVASPRHADIVTVTGPMTAAMREPARLTIEAVPGPSLVVAVGDCAAGCGPWGDAPNAGTGAGAECAAAVTVLGCPPTPEAIREGLRRAAELLDGDRS